VTAPAQLRVIDLQLRHADRGAVPKPAQRFAPDDTVIVYVVTQGSAAGADLRARVAHEGKVLVDQSTQFAPTGTTVTQFAASWPEGWPAGAYRVELLLDGAAAGQAEFKVEGGKAGGKS
jgi:hypothetical protein